MERDFSFVLADGVIFEQIDQAVSKLKLSELRSFAPAEVFRGGNVPAGKYSIYCGRCFSRTRERSARTRWRSGPGRSSGPWKGWAACCAASREQNFLNSGFLPTCHKPRKP